MFCESQLGSSPNLYVKVNNFISGEGDSVLSVMDSCMHGTNLFTASQLKKNRIPTKRKVEGIRHILST